MDTRQKTMKGHDIPHSDFRRLLHNIRLLGRCAFVLLGAAALLGFGVPEAVAAGPRSAVQTSFLYRLSNFSGPVPFNWAGISVDAWRNEIYVVDAKEGGVSIFDAEGMEVYRFGDDGSLGSLLDVAVKEDGDIFGLVRRMGKTSVVLCNFRGEPLSDVTPKNLPPDFSGFRQDKIVYRDGRLYHLDSASMRIAVTDSKGIFLKGYDLGVMLEIDEKKREEMEVGGFSVDREGNMLFTVPLLFAAFTLSPEGGIKGFGRSGSAPGRFGIVGGIVADDQGNYYVADRLKSAVLIFDRDFNFLREFGYRGSRPDNLVAPNNLALDPQGRIYVSQLRDRGISVFKMTYR